MMDRYGKQADESGQKGRYFQLALQVMADHALLQLELAGADSLTLPPAAGGS